MSANRNDKEKELGDAHGDWYYCLNHRRVEGISGCDSSERMGPYPTREDAEHWRERVAARNEVWDDE